MRVTECEGERVSSFSRLKVLLLSFSKYKEGREIP